MVVPTTGVLPAMAAGFPYKATSTLLTVTLDVIGAGLYPGTFTGSITIVGTCSSTGEPAVGSPARIAVNLTVTAVTATIVVDDDRLDQDATLLTDEWTPVPTEPSARGGHTAVWTGREMIVWGGMEAGVSVNTGARYDADHGRWYTIDASGAPSARRGHRAVWTGGVMIVWGGVEDGGTHPTDGGIYDPVSNSWITISTIAAPSPSTRPGVIWTGTAMLTWGGYGIGGTGVGTGGEYH